MLRHQNIISLGMVAGFFLGLMFSVLNFDEPLDMILITMLVTFTFYMLIVFSTSYFLQTYVAKEKLFAKSIFEEAADTLTDDLSQYERKIDSILLSINKVRNTIEHQDIKVNS